MDNLAVEGYTTIPNLLTHDECSKLCEWINQLFAAEPELDGLDVEGYDRLRVKKPGLSELVRKRLSEKLHLGHRPSDNTNRTQQQNQLVVFSQWFPTKYISGGGLGIHIDGTASEDENTSTHTILIYLNAEFMGGRTVFVDDYDDPPVVEGNNHITPEPGLALILEQDKLHFAEPLSLGTKYILRGDIIIS
jgi:hypothetical protein